MNDQSTTCWQRCHKSTRPVCVTRAFFYVSLLSVLGFSAIPAHAVQLIDPPAVAPDSAANVRQFLVTDWDRSRVNRTNSKTSFTAAGKTTTEVTIAYLVNRIQHNQKKEALEIAEQITEREPKSIDGWFLKAHLNALLDNYDRSLIDLRSVKKLSDENVTLTDQQQLKIYRRMGSLIGYLQGPVKAKINPDMLAGTVNFIVNGTSDERLAAFNESRETILQRFDDKLQSENAKTQTELEKQAAVDANLDEVLTKQNQQLEKASSELISQIEQLQAEGSRRIGDLVSQISPVESNLNSLSSQISSAQFDLQLLYTDLFNAQNVPPGYRTSTWFLQDQIRIREFSLASMQSNANSMSRQLQSLQGQINQTRIAYDSKIGQLQQQGRNISGNVRRNQNKLAKIAIGPEIADGKKEAINDRIVALTSYLELPLELYRQQLLDLVGK